MQVLIMLIIAVSTNINVINDTAFCLSNCKIINLNIDTIRFKNVKETNIGSLWQKKSFQASKMLASCKYLFYVMNYHDYLS